MPATATHGTYAATTQRFQSGHPHVAAAGKGPQGRRNAVIGEAIFRASAGPLCSCVLRPRLPLY